MNTESANKERLVELTAQVALLPDKPGVYLMRDAAGKIMWSLCGDLPEFEEASRALYAKDAARFLALSSSWPPDPRAYLVGLIRQATALEAEATPAAAERAKG